MLKSEKTKLKPNAIDIRKLKREVKDLARNKFLYIDKEMIDILKLFIGRDDLFPIECCSSHPDDIDDKTDEYKDTGYLMIIARDDNGRKLLDKVIIKLLQGEYRFHFSLTTEIDEAYESLEDFRPILVNTINWECWDTIVREKLLLELKKVLMEVLH